MLNLLSFFFLFLFTNSSLYSMGAHSTLDKLSDDLIVYGVGGYLNRTTRCALRQSSKKYSRLILRQSTLNKNYTDACAAHDEKKAAEWRKQGGLHYHEEVYDLFIKDKKNLSTVWLQQEHGLTQHCVLSAFLHGVIRNNKDFIQWLLAENKSIDKNKCISEAIELAKKNRNRDITQFLEAYIKPPTYWGSDCLR